MADGQEDLSERNRCSTLPCASSLFCLVHWYFIQTRSEAVRLKFPNVPSYHTLDSLEPPSVTPAIYYDRDS